MSVFGLVALVGCGDDTDGTDTPDAGSSVDAKVNTPDSGTVAPTHSGTIGVHEIELLAPFNAAGKGSQINISFTPTGGATTASFSRPGALPCTASLVTKAQEVAAVDEGPVKVTVKKAGGAAGSLVPACSFISGTYRCLNAMGAGGTLAKLSDTLYSFAPSAAATFSSVANTGNYLIDTSNGKAYPVVGASATALAIQGGTGAAAGPVGAWLLLAGIGPIAFTANPDGSGVGGPPEFLNDDDTVKVEIMGKTGGHFTATATSDIAVGKSFELDDATAALLAAGQKLNLSTTDAISFGCKMSGAKACGASTGLNGTLVVIDSTDATNAGAADLGTNGTMFGSLICAELGPSVAVPKEAFAVLKQGNPKKLRISVFRDALEPLSNATPPRNSVNVVAGHGLVTFQSL